MKFQPEYEFIGPGGVRMAIGIYTPENTNYAEERALFAYLEGRKEWSPYFSENAQAMVIALYDSLRREHDSGT